MSIDKAYEAVTEARQIARRIPHSEQTVKLLNQLDEAKRQIEMAATDVNTVLGTRR